MPPRRPLTLPEPSTDALPFDELQVPPLTASVSDIPEPAHIATDPVMVPATVDGLTVTTAVATTVPQPLLTV